MSKTFFVADLHLTIDNQVRTDLALSFIDKVINASADLYILGDFFDFWANNSILLKKHLRVLQKLQELVSHGQKVCLLFGNRDFLIRPETLTPFGITFLGEEAEIILGPKRIHLTHGHTLCLSDIEFLRYKQRMWPIFRFLDRIIPGPLENYIAKKFILKSKQVISTQEQVRFDFSRNVIERHFNSGIDVIICGHAHKLKIQPFGKNCFYALPAWEDNKGNFLVCTDTECSFHEFSKSG